MNVTAVQFSSRSPSAILEYELFLVEQKRHITVNRWNYARQRHISFIYFIYFQLLLQHIWILFNFIFLLQNIKTIRNILCCHYYIFTPKYCRCTIEALQQGFWKKLNIIFPQFPDRILIFFLTLKNILNHSQEIIRYSKKFSISFIDGFL